MSFTPSTSHWQSPMVLDGPKSTPIMSSPTSAPKSSILDKQKRPKLRASCDACAASKVKCSKEHPACARCSTNGSQCIYGVSRKHGKPGRTRKRNPDGTPYIKASKQRPSPDGSEFGKFRIRPEPLIEPLPDMETASSWSSNWSSTPSLPGTPEIQFEMTPEPFYMNFSDLTFMDDILLPTSQLEPEPMQTIESELAFRDPFAKRPSVQLNLPDLQALKDFIGGDIVNPMDYTLQNNAPTDPFDALSTSSSPHSPKSNSMDNYNPMRVSISMPTSHCCYTLAYSTLESLRVIGSDNPQNYPHVELKSLDSVLSISKLAVQSVLQLLSCPCSSDPHLAMLYSSITSKILTWYQIAAGVNVTASSGASSSPSLNSSSSYSSSPSSSGFSTPLSTPMSESEMTFNIQIQPLRFGLYEFDEVEQERLRRQVVLRELKKCGQLVEALANWRGDGQSDQAEFLYDVLGAWLKSELFKTVREVEGIDAL
ncbi:Nn.00g073360.m01.CDS01 [Neocucurbitaria sp. VM-36]